MANEHLRHGSRRPRVLVTGFPAFPGAPANPTEWLVHRLVEQADALGAELSAKISAAVIPCSYDGAPRALEQLAREVDPNIHLAFGLSRSAQGFVLEREARNACPSLVLDTDGHCYGAGPIRTGAGESIPGTLPLEAIANALARESLGVSFSTDAGGYLCNYVFYLSAGGHIPSLRTDLSGFVHVPQIDEAAGPSSGAFTRDMLWRGSLVCLREAVLAWQRLGSCDFTLQGPHLSKGRSGCEH